jgi:hypothetical protein
MVESFYSCHSTGKAIPYQSPIEVSLEQVLDLAREVLREEGDFLGVVGNDGAVVQLRVEGDSRVWVEAPDAAQGKAFGRLVWLVDVVDVLRSLREPFGKESIKWNEVRSM